jgi:RNA polymerase sigma-70 factor (ECF subfamily)
MPDVRAEVEAVFRRESGQILASLIRISGSFDRAEEALQEALASSLASWPQTGIPQKPAAWIMTAAHRKLIDSIRREHTRREKQDSLLYETETVAHPFETDLNQPATCFPDDRLRLIFTCCHPALNREAQVALTLRTLGGLSTEEIARAFLLPEDDTRAADRAGQKKDPGGADSIRDAARRPARRTACIRAGRYLPDLQRRILGYRRTGLAPARTLCRGDPVKPHDVRIAAE